jgi:hypothetical protein
LYEKREFEYKMNYYKKRKEKEKEKEKENFTITGVDLKSKKSEPVIEIECDSSLTHAPSIKKPLDITNNDDNINNMCMKIRINYEIDENLKI